MQFQNLYQKIINKPFIKFDDFYFIDFYADIKDNIVHISDQFAKDYDYFNIKCRKLSKQNWDTVYSEQDNGTRQKLLLLFSICQTNFVNVEFSNGCLSLQSLNKILSLNVCIVKHIICKINEYCKSQQQEDEYRNQLTLQFRKLYNSDKGIVLKHKQIGQYLHLCSFYEKLGLNYFDLQKLPYNVYKQMMMMMGIQTEIKNEQLRQLNKQTKKMNRGKR